MPKLWDAFVQDYQDEISSWSTVKLLEIFWHYCQDGSRAVDKLLNKKEESKANNKIH